MDPLPSVVLVAGRGLEGNANQGGRRQVTLIEEERWAEATAEIGADLPPWSRRANLMISGLSLESSRGRILRI
ncbi:MAG TPA: sulfurase, partial [Thermoanaerobaculia bacterium]|nr:sulfurase [Thermoanaerobaculia bacterium]